MEFFEFRLPARVTFGNDALADLPLRLEELGVTRPVLLTDPGVRAAGVVDRVLAALGGGAGVPIFDQIPPNSSLAAVQAGLEVVRQAGADGLIAVGGGSVMDTAKAVNLLHSLGGDLADYQGVGVITRAPGPLVAIPTTAGTGSEVTPFAVIRDEAAGIKYAFASPYLVPSLAVLVPELTLGLPRSLTAATGMDAMTHAVEAYISNDHNPFSDALAVAAMGTIYRYLPRAVAEPDDREARAAMLIASTQAGMAFGSALVGAVHAISHALGGIYNVPHGTANACLLPWVLEFNLPAAEERLAGVARALGVAGPTDPAPAAARAGIAALARLVEELGLPRRIRELGVPYDNLEAVAALALSDGSYFTNPRQADEEELLALIRRAW